MIILYSILKLLHIVSAIAMVAGGLGRQIARAHVRRAVDLPEFLAALRIARTCERVAVPGSIAVVGFGLALAWVRGWPLFGFLQGAQANWLLVSLLLYLAIYPLVIFIFIPTGRVFRAALAAAIEQGCITRELSAAFDDRRVRFAYRAEYFIVAAILVLMVAKPF